MSFRNKDASEKNFQDNFVAELQKYRWKYEPSLDGNLRKVTVKDLEDNWRKELNRLNGDQLEGVELTDNEFNQVLSKVKKISNSYEAAKILAMEDATGKIDGIYRDPNPSLTRTQITLTIFKKIAVGGGESNYQIAREVTTEKGSRFDIILLINGLPLINVEQKRTDKHLIEAYGQFKRYYLDGEYTHNFMAFSQMMVVSSEIDTRYFATPKSYDAFNPAFMFGWADRNNKPISNWKKIVESFLKIPMAHQMVGEYLVIDEAKEEENRKHMILRSYQVYAIQAVEAAARGKDNPDNIPHGGFVWHTTGSGKTITSFKTALFLSNKRDFDKVVFLVDRRELDSRTSENFKAYAAYESVTVDDTPHTYHLKRELESGKSGIVVTTTFKLNNLLAELISNDDYRLSDKSIVFIIDEAHRTTMGEMMGTIKNFFRKKGYFFGFTGTPLFEENNIDGMIDANSEIINTTEKLFGPLLHKYTIDEAIADGNVLGFHVDYINTGEFKSHQWLREKLIEKMIRDKPLLSDREVERIVHGWSDSKVESEGLLQEIFKYQDETHIPRVVDSILKNWEKQSQNYTFNAILTVAYKERVIAYYHEFQKQMKKMDRKLNVAMTFSFGNENDPENVSLAIIKKMFNDYSKFTGVEYLAGDKKHGENAYYEDLTARATRGGSGRSPKNIDLVIVAEQMLTGYDSKLLNTLYVDRQLKLQSLIQAYSRTNRVYGKEKEFGSIVNFRLPKQTEEEVNRGLVLYGSGGTSSRAIVEPYETSVKNLFIEVGHLKTSLGDPTNWKMLTRDEKSMIKFIETFKSTVKQLSRVTQYYQFEWDNHSFGLTEHQWLQYVGAFENLTYSPGSVDTEDIIIPLVTRAKLVGTQIIDQAHILKLIGEKVTESSGIQSIDDESLRDILEQIQELSNMGHDQQAQLLKEFVDTELTKGNISASLPFDESFSNWKKVKLSKEIERYANTFGYDIKLLTKSLNNFSDLNPDFVPHRDDLIFGIDYSKVDFGDNNSRFNYIDERTSDLPIWMAKVKNLYE